MKRDKNLETLSWEHHNGLVAAFRLKRGLKKKDVDISLLRQYTLDVWNDELEHHFRQEEEVLVEPLRSEKAGRELLDRMLSDHERFRELITVIDTEKDGVAESIAEFADLLERHVRFEERQLFEWLQDNTSADQLAAIGKFLHEQHRPVDKCYTPEFWK